MPYPCIRVARTSPWAAPKLCPVSDQHGADAFSGHDRPPD
jgi:hypothetical protein